jgi:hypothetical protein
MFDDELLRWQRRLGRLEHVHLRLRRLLLSERLSLLLPEPAVFDDELLRG